MVCFCFSDLVTFANKNLTQPEIMTAPNTRPPILLFTLSFHRFTSFPRHCIPSSHSLLALFTDLPSCSLALFIWICLSALYNTLLSVLISVEQSPNILPWTIYPFLWSLMYLPRISFCTSTTLCTSLVNRAVTHFAFCWKWLSLPSCKSLLILWDTSFFGKAFLISTIQAKLYALFSSLVPCLCFWLLHWFHGYYLFIWLSSPISCLSVFSHICVY